MEDIPQSLHKDNSHSLLFTSTDVFTLHLHYVSSASMITQNCHEDTLGSQSGDPKIKEKFFIPKKGTL